MESGKLLRFPVRNPQMFSPEINSQVLGSSRIREVLYAAINALPHVSEPGRREDLKRALCELLLSEDGVA
ncbi:MAG TPA: hypothetical protein VJ731_06605 [Terriglobales bacterium]|jgi:hypothetical protein|nr:hypothetical protein [Terriglobales bacterium]